jgi:DNA-binding transcriptional regulator YbjK
MGCQVEIPEVGGCLKDFIEALPPGTLDQVVETMDAALARASDETLGKVDGAIRGLERKVAALLSERNTITGEIARVQAVLDAAEQFLRRIDCPELRVLKAMWDDQKRALAERLAQIDTGPVEDALRTHRELKTALACQRANARKVTDFVRSLRGT